MHLEARDDAKGFFFRLVDGEDVSPWASYTQVCYLKGSVGVTDYFTGEGEKVLTPDEYCQLIAVK